jgi:hypothetical protein
MIARILTIAVILVLASCGMEVTKQTSVVYERYSSH